jgi:hypothetical protein
VLALLRWPARTSLGTPVVDTHADVIGAGST